MRRRDVRENRFIYAFVVFGIALAVASIIFGSVLPFMKSQRYTYAVSVMWDAESVEEVEALFGRALTFYSPVGASEVARFSGDMIFSIISGGRQSEAVGRALIEFIEPSMDKEDIRHLLVLGYMYSEMWEKYRNSSYLQKAEMYFLRAHERGPKPPPPLYALFGVYQEGNDAERARAIAERILELWPQETRIQIQ